MTDADRAQLVERLRGANVTCQFCSESGFDFPGLANHVRRGWCNQYNAFVDQFDAWTPPSQERTK